MLWHRFRRAFTLIELLVVIAIIALLISILLPALGRARRSGKLVISLSNLRQISTASSSYRSDNRGMLPFQLSFTRGGRSLNPTNPTAGLEGACTWSYGGKNNDTWWGALASRGFDVEAADRPLNQYVAPTIECWAPPIVYGQAPVRLPANAEDRVKLKLPMFKDPTDITTYQRPVAGHPFPWPTVGISSYDDVGTSYHFNLKWLDEDDMRTIWNQDAIRAWSAGMQRMKVADDYASSRFVIFNDQYADITVNNDDPRAMVVNGYGDTNKSCMAFMDGHAKYLPVIPGHSAESFSNEMYTFIFTDLRVR